MSNFNEHSLEMAIMELYEQQGYGYVNGETMPEHYLLCFNDESELADSRLNHENMVRRKFRHTTQDVYEKIRNFRFFYMSHLE